MAKVVSNDFQDYLIASENYEDYMYQLVEAYNPVAVANVMCTNTLSVSWNGYLYDCDFNQMLELPVNSKIKHISEYNEEILEGRDIVISQHCYGCTAGAGSSCQGTVAQAQKRNMMTEALVIVFVKNIKLGKVKTRLAKTIGDHGAFEVYKELVKITKNATETLGYDKHIYFSDTVIDNKWKNDYKTTQKGEDLGERMLNAFKNGFEAGYKKIVLIGSDLPEINANHIKKGIETLDNNEVVFGPAEDGGYYLVGMSSLIEEIFLNNLKSIL